MFSPSVVLRIRKMDKSELLELLEAKFGESVRVKGPDGIWYRCLVVEVLGERDRIQIAVKRMDSLVVRENSAKAWPKVGTIQKVPIELVERVPVFRTIRVAPPGTIVGTFGMLYSYNSDHSKSKRQVCMSKDGFLYLMDVTQMRVSEVVRRRVDVRKITGVWLKMICSEDDDDNDNAQLQVRLHIPTDMPDLVLETGYHHHGYSKFVDLRYIVDLIKTFRDKDEEEFIIENLTEEKDHQNEKFLDGIFRLQDNVPKPGEKKNLRLLQQQQQQRKLLAASTLGTTRMLPSVGLSHSGQHQMGFASSPTMLRTRMTDDSPTSRGSAVLHSPIKSPSSQIFSNTAEIEASETTDRIQLQLTRIRDLLREHNNLSVLTGSYSNGSFQQLCKEWTNEAQHQQQQQPLRKMASGYTGIGNYVSSVEVDSSTSGSLTKTTQISSSQSSRYLSPQRSNLAAKNLDAEEEQQRQALVLHCDNCFWKLKCEFLEERDTIKQRWKPSHLQETERLFHARMTNLKETAAAIDLKKESQRKLHRLRSGKLRQPSSSRLLFTDVDDEPMQRSGIELDALQSLFSLRTQYITELELLPSNRDVDVYNDEDFYFYCDDMLGETEDRLTNSLRIERSQTTLLTPSCATTNVSEGSTVLSPGHSRLQMSKGDSKSSLSSFHTEQVAPSEKSSKRSKNRKQSKKKEKKEKKKEKRDRRSQKDTSPDSDLPKKGFVLRSPTRVPFRTGGTHEDGECVPVTNISHLDIFPSSIELGRPSFRSSPLSSSLNQQPSFRTATATSPTSQTSPTVSRVRTWTIRRPAPNSASFQSLGLQVELDLIDELLTGRDATSGGFVF
eukprot:TRINITY_DN21920_c0_g1_i1.p1 TRINITY_DN21920_c0_g1~~TRINITY_DN21920_c0_g1_i1.p1  ORF type:complete len:866 (+),score=147.25 TRINITY_DN21920_c0_g1_i1:91-2598(+)